MNSEQAGYPMQAGQPSQAISPQMGMSEEGPEMENTPQDTADDSVENELAREINSKNLALTLDEEMLQKISTQCKTGFETDLRSRQEWERDLDDWLKLAMQIREEKSYPWPKASNIKYPLISTAAMQFAARAYPSLVPSSGKVVNSVVIGKDPTGEKRAKGDRVSTYMSYQVMHQMGDWEEDMDKLLMMLPIVGTVFKKTYYDKAKDQICSYLISPKSLVVNYWATSLEDSERVSEIIEMPRRKYNEKVLQGVYKKHDFGQPQVNNLVGTAAKTEHVQDTVDESTPYIFIEQHTYYDMDKDGYEEPCLVTFELASGKIVSILPRFMPEDVEANEDGKITKIEPTQYYTKFSFVPNPDGSFYSLGFGVLLGPINEAINTLINQLVDAGTMSNLQSGFIGKGLRLKMGEQKFTPGEWKAVNATGDDLKKQIVPLPVRDPSNVLFQLMGSLVTSGKELASVAEIFTGKMPGQNTPATTTMATVEQGMKVFTAVYKRIFRSLASEFKKIYKLNSVYIDPNYYVAVLDSEIGPEDFSDDEYDICPGADPTAVSQSEKLMKAQGLMELMPSGILDPVKVVQRILEAQEQPNWEELIKQEVQQSGQMPQQPNPKEQEMQMKMQMEQQKAGVMMQMNQQKMELEGRSKEQKMAMEAQAHQQKMQQQAETAQMQAAADMHKQKIFMVAEQLKAQQGLVQSQQQHQMKLAQTKESAKSTSQKKTGSTGKRQT
jgi:chaperonin GroES